MQIGLNAWSLLRLACHIRGTKSRNRTIFLFTPVVYLRCVLTNRISVLCEGGPIMSVNRPHTTHRLASLRASLASIFLAIFGTTSFGLYTATGTRAAVADWLVGTGREIVVIVSSDEVLRWFHHSEDHKEEIITGTIKPLAPRQAQGTNPAPSSAQSAAVHRHKPAKDETFCDTVGHAIDHFFGFDAPPQ